MMSYRDMTFCPFYDECAFGDVCPRALTEDVRKGSNIMGLPLAMFIDKPECFKEVVEEDE